MVVSPPELVPRRPVPLRLDDPELVRREYADERRLARRRALYRRLLHGDDPVDVAFGAVAALGPARVLQVGCGRGAFARRVADELGAEVVALDLSPRMVSLSRRLGVDARVGDVQGLPFDAASFDCAVASWMLHHVPRLDRALGELARVLSPGGSLVATTPGETDQAELWSLSGAPSFPDLSFSAENGRATLGRHFARVERREVRGELEFHDAAVARRFVAASIAGRHLAPFVPDFAGPLRIATVNCVFTATGPAR